MDAGSVHYVLMALTQADVRLIQDALEPGFGAIGRLLNGLEQRFDALEHRVDDLTILVQSHVTGTAQRFDAVEDRLHRIEQHLGLPPVMP